MFDLARLVYDFADADARREAEMTLLDDYYQRLQDELAKQGRPLEVGLEQASQSHQWLTKKRGRASADDLTEENLDMRMLRSRCCSPGTERRNYSVHIRREAGRILSGSIRCMAS